MSKQLHKFDIGELVTVLRNTYIDQQLGIASFSALIAEHVKEDGPGSVLGPRYKVLINNQLYHLFENDLKAQ